MGTTRPGAHVVRISHYTVELAAALGLDAEFLDTIHYASPMHDVGKIGIPDAILGKPGTFEPHEWETMKTHAALGAKHRHIGGQGLMDVDDL